MRTLLLYVLLLGSDPPSLPAHDAPVITQDERAAREAGAAAMEGAAESFVAALDESARKKALRPFDHPSRTDWSYVRGDREGLFLRDMTALQREKAMALLVTALSKQGLARVERTRINEDINRGEEVARKQREPTYGADLYALLMFGTPGDGLWGWRFEGHHIGLHFSSASGETTTTPLFFGSFPAELRAGPLKGTRPLGAEQDLALALRRSFNETQTTLARIADNVPGDSITSPGREAMLKSPEQQGGIAMTDLNAEQRDQLWGLVVRYANDLRGELASDALRRIKAAGTQNLRFGFAGEPAVDKPHYFRIGGPTFVIEFDCTQGNPDHVHCVWNDPERNFGDALRRHVQEEHAAPQHDR
ncbi:MAG: DUF3500 domain-containing protein [Phycisphaerae bacterium]|nr:DUF3500 domain-containing protein [Phycisphaerae bacterium]